MCIYIYIPQIHKYKLLSLYDITCMYAFSSAFFLVQTMTAFPRTTPHSRLGPPTSIASQENVPQASLMTATPQMRFPPPR